MEQTLDNVEGNQTEEALVAGWSAPAHTQAVQRLLRELGAFVHTSSYTVPSFNNLLLRSAESVRESPLCH